MLGLSPGIKISILSKSGHSTSVLSNIDMQSLGNVKQCYCKITATELHYNLTALLPKGVYIATQLNSTELNSTAWTVDSVCRSWRHKQKHDWLGCTLFNWVSWVVSLKMRIGQ